jgi:hypothetical protein
VDSAREFGEERAPLQEAAHFCQAVVRFGKGDEIIVDQFLDRAGLGD